jgi:hypothetical protein
MKKLHVFLQSVICLLVVFGSGNLIALSLPPPKLHVLTVASDMTQGAKQLLATCKKNGVEIEILGLGQPYQGNGHKLVHLKEKLKSYSWNDIVLFVDAYDILFMADTKTILEKFYNMKSSFVIAAEKNCFPFKELADQYPPSPTPFRFLNSGSFIGKVHVIQKILEDLEPIIINSSDQAQFTKHYLKHPELYTFDYQCELFLPLSTVKESDVRLNYKKKTVDCLITNTKPCIVHGNGRGRKFYQKIYDKLYPPVE